MIGSVRRALATSVRGRGAADTRQARLDGIVATITSLSAGVGLEETLRTIVRKALELVEAEYGAIGVRNRGPEMYEFVFEGTPADAVERIGEPPEGRGIIGAVIERSAPLRLDDISKHPRSTGFPVNHPAMHTFLGVPVVIGGETVGSLYVTEKAGRRSFTDDDEAVLEILATAASLVIARARLEDAERTRQAWIEATRDVTIALLAGTDTTAILRLICERTQALAGAAGALVAIPADDTQPDELVVAAATGPGLEAALGRRIPIAGNDIGRAYAERRTHRSSRFTERNAGFGPIEAGPAIVAPLHTKDAVAGVVLAIRERRDQLFSVEQVDILTSFADQAALAMQSATARRRMRDANVRSDRDRIATDMHDHVIQRLFAVGLTVQSTIPRDESPAVKARLAETVDDLHQVVQAIRTTIFDVHDTGDKARGLRERIEQAVSAFAVPQLRTELTIAGPLSGVGPALADHAEAVVREACSNVVRHAEAQVLTVVIRVEDGLTIDVSDDGVGMRAEGLRSGLANLAARALELGGTFDVHVRDTGGTQLSWSVPLS